MIKQDEVIELKAEKLTYLGSALAHYEGMAVFLEDAVPGDTVLARVVRINKSYMRAKTLEVIEPSPHRVKPFCPIFKACGGCNLQYVDYDFLASEKENILKEAFKGVEGEIEFKPIIKSDKTTEYRCKVQYPTSETKVSKRILAGYFKEKTHEIVNVKYCPVQKNELNDIVEFLRENWKLGGYVEKTKKGLLRHFVCRQSDTNNALFITLVLNIDERTYGKQFNREVENFTDLIMGKFKNIKGIMVNFNPIDTNRILGETTQLVKGEDFITETLKDASGKGFKYKISKDSFFQTNPSCAAKLFSAVKEFIKEDTNVLDAYGGVGAIGIFCSDKTRKITLVEENENAVKDAKENFKLNSVGNYEVFLGNAKEKFKEFIKAKKSFKTIILDPPRKGSDKEVLELVAKLGESIVYVSCNPQTLARDVKELQQLGFVLKSVQGVDMFPFTYHIESVAYLEKLP